MWARTTGAFPSGRNVNDFSSRSSKVYISLETISVSSPTPRANSSVLSKIGVRTSAKPYRSKISRAVFSTRVQSADSGGRISRVPLMDLITVLESDTCFGASHSLDSGPSFPILRGRVSFAGPRPSKKSALLLQIILLIHQVVVRVPVNALDLG